MDEQRRLRKIEQLKRALHDAFEQKRMAIADLDKVQAIANKASDKVLSIQRELNQLQNWKTVVNRSDGYYADKTRKNV